MKIDAVLFDKDGTLYDFQATWSVFAKELIHAFPSTPPEEVAQVIGFDIEAGRFLPDAAFVSCTAEEDARRLSGIVGRTPAQILATFHEIGRDTPQVPVEGMEKALASLAPRPLGIATNDAEASARAHLETSKISDHFSFVAGYDSGHGAKPEAGQLLAFASAVGLAPNRIAMVGDSLHDLTAARKAGMAAVAVLTGTAMREDLAHLADVVLPDITHLPNWLDRF